MQNLSYYFQNIGRQIFLIPLRLKKGPLPYRFWKFCTIWRLNFEIFWFGLFENRYVDRLDLVVFAHVRFPKNLKLVGLKLKVVVALLNAKFWV